LGAAASRRSFGCLRQGLSSTSIRRMAAGNGAIYAAGVFTGAGNVRASRVAAWNGSTWNPLGSGLKGVNENTGTNGRALAIDDSDVFVGGTFTNAGGVLIVSWCHCVCGRGRARRPRQAFGNSD
jgi:hypothetical protein